MQAPICRMCTIPLHSSSVICQKILLSNFNLIFNMEFSYTCLFTSLKVVMRIFVFDWQLTVYVCIMILMADWCLEIQEQNVGMPFIAVSFIFTYLNRLSTRLTPAKARLALMYSINRLQEHWLPGEPPRKLLSVIVELTPTRRTQELQWPALKYRIRPQRKNLVFSVCSARTSIITTISRIIKA